MWKTVVDDPRYEVSDEGKVRNKKTGYMMKLSLNHDGYIRITKMRGTTLVHRMVAMAFLPKSEIKQEVNHKDFNRTNNCVGNLEWVSHGDNVRYSTVANRYPHSKPKLYRPVIMLDESKNEIRRFDGIVCAVDFLGRPRNSGNSNILRSIKNPHMRTYGYFWKYAE